MFYTDSPTDDFERYTAEQERELDRLPRCSCCKEHIQQAEAVYYDGNWCCEECEDEFFYKKIRKDFLCDTGLN